MKYILTADVDVQVIKLGSNNCGLNLLIAIKLAFIIFVTILKVIN